MDFFRSIGQKALRKKPLWIFERETDQSELHPTYNLFSLLMIGIGGTIGSGIFISCGKIASQDAGPAVTLSWIIAAICAAFTALAYCELAAKLLSSGAAYAFAYYGLGEIFALVGGIFLCLEYGMSAAAVARSWGDKLAYWLIMNEWVDCTSDNCFVNAVGGTAFNPAALLMSLLCTLVILGGVKLEKTVVNVLVVIKIALVMFIIIVGATYANGENLTPFIPPADKKTGFTGGFSGVFLGATEAFFGFIGFDEICMMAGEAKNPKRNIPLAVLGTLLAISVFYVAASLVLTSMVPYYNIDPSEGFGSAFVQVGASWAMQVTVAGEVFIVLPTVVLVAYIPQLRLFYVMAKDGQLPGFLARVTKKGTLLPAGIATLVIFSLVAALVPFDKLNDLCSGGVLLSYILSNCSLLLTRSEIKGNNTSYPVAAMTIAMGICCSFVNYAEDHVTLVVGSSIFGALSVALMAYIAIKHDFTAPAEAQHFTVPFVPILPSLAIFLNWFLITQLSASPGILSIVILLVLCLILYIFQGYRKAVNFEELKSPEQLDGTIATEKKERSPESPQD